MKPFRAMPVLARAPVVVQICVAPPRKQCAQREQPAGVPRHKKPRAQELASGETRLDRRP